MANKLSTTTDSKDPTWGELVATTSDWQRQRQFSGIPATLSTALEPYIGWVVRRDVERIPWGQRLHILFTGGFPEDL